MKNLFCILFISLSFVASAQEKSDITSTIQSESEVMVSISACSLYRLENERNQAVQERNKLQESCAKLLKQDSVNTKKLNDLEPKYNLLKSEYDLLAKSQELANKKLVNIASNFLFIPYEAYSIQEIAIPAFKAVTDKQLLRKHQIKLTLLENYQQDIRDLLEFISNVEKELCMPFANLKDLEKQFLEKEFYLRYNQYESWKNTYLGKIIDSIDAKMKSYNRTNKPDFTSIKNELNQCLETIKDL